MTRAQLLITVILIQQGLFAFVWVLGASLGIASRAAWHWAAAAALVAAGMGLVLLRPSVDPWIGFVLANLLLVAAMVVLRRGILCFARSPSRDTEHALVLLLTAAGLALALGRQAPLASPLVAVISLALAWTLLRCAREVAQALGSEVAAAAARWCALPFALFGTVFLLRALGSWLLGPRGSAGLSGDDAASIGVGLGSLVLCLVLNLTLIAITAMRLIWRLQHQSEHDALTGLWNRRAMQRWLADEQERQHRMGSPYAVLSVDIDHFKNVNDRHGHGAGDAVLVRVGQALENSLRRTDRVARMGGEEFCVLLPGSDEVGAAIVADRLLAAVRELAHAEIEGAGVTISVGIAVPHGRDETVESLMQRLDRALYDAKHAGRDRRAMAQPPAAVPA